MMVCECTSTCYVLFWIVVVPTSDPKDLFMECVTMFTVQITGLIWVGLVE
jgi:ubiquitin C-terminal hydrolase